MALQLRYAFVPTPYPVRASVDGANPNTVDLRITISPPGLSAVTLSGIQVQVPVGNDAVAGDLSGAASLPQPSAITGAEEWDVSVVGSVVTLLGDEDGTAIGGPIELTLAGITVNEAAGTVPITITELPVPGGKVVDGSTYSLFKEDPDYPISNFWASPSELNDLDQTVTLFWTCTGQGEAFAYSLHSDSWCPRNCLQQGQCFACADGAAGVTSPQLAQSTTFSLDVIGTEGGDRVIVSTLQVSVPVLVPSISQNSWVEQLPQLGGRFVRIHWLAQNAASCSVRVNNTVVASGAPADTYDDGFLVSLGGPGTWPLSIVAHAAQGTATATLQLGEFAVEDTAHTAGTQMPAKSVAVTPDSTTAWAGCYDKAEYLAVLFVPVHLATGNASQATPSFFQAPPLLSPDARAAAQLLSNSVVLLYTIDPLGGPTGGQLDGVCAVFTPDGTELLVGCADGTLARVPFPAPSEGGFQKVAVGGTPAAVAVSAPSGGPALALAAVPSAGGVTVVDLHTFTAEPAVIPVAAVAGAMAATPDGSVVLVANHDAGTLTFIDLPNRTADARTITVGASPRAIAVSPDGALGFVANHGDATVTVVDVARRRALVSLPVPANPTSLAVSGDGKYVVVGCDSSKCVVVLGPAAGA